MGSFGSYKVPGHGPGVIDDYGRTLDDVMSLGVGIQRDCYAKVGTSCHENPYSQHRKSTCKDTNKKPNGVQLSTKNFCHSSDSS